MQRIKTIAIFGVILLLLTVPVAANGKPVTIYLSFLPEFSNTGAESAAGTVQVSIGEAWVDLTADGLPQLQGEQYEGWLQEAETGKRFSVGKFNADANGHVAYYIQLDNIPVADYQYFLITIEPDPDPSPDADARITIAGLFPNPQLMEVTPTPIPTATAPLATQPVTGTKTMTGTASATEGDSAMAVGATPTPPPPAVLPVTGNSTSPWLLLMGGLLFGAGVFTLKHGQRIGSD